LFSETGCKSITCARRAGQARWIRRLPRKRQRWSCYAQRKDRKISRSIAIAVQQQRQQNTTTAISVMQCLAGTIRSRSF
jgi:hypothetical protein